VTGKVTIVEIGKDRLDDLEPLWKALQEHHIKVGAHLGEARTPEESWAIRRQDYEAKFDEEGVLVLLAEFDGSPVGYAFVKHRGKSATYRIPEPTAELKTLSVVPEYRGRGIGDLLMQEVFTRLRERGIRELAIGVVATNDGAIRFYERYGFFKRYITMWGAVPEPRPSR
jgi:ribosomal protein S18 acetylase RimI-like enzyme